MPLSGFHPVVARWFTETLGAPTPAQRQGWSAIREGRHTLIAAPTGSGKTLAAFLTSIDDLLQEGLRAPPPDEVRVVYVSPLKALSADIHKNLAEPRRGIRRIAEEMGLDAPRITAAVRTGDTTQKERAAMLRTPPHILVTTPESLYLLLTAERSRGILRTTRTVIVDEIHAVIGTRRGAHLALTLERLQQVAQQPLIRLGLSATQKPIEEVARFLVGTAAVNSEIANSETASSETTNCATANCAIVNEGHRRAMDLGIEMPRSTLEAVMSHEVWEEYYERLTALIAAHQTTLVFVNTRRMAERVARHLSERLGDDAVTAHHGSLSKEKRLDAETRLKAGQLKALCATASLELGIDIGSVDLVCQIGSPHRIATLLQRVGRSGHSVSGLPKGRLFPVSRDDLIECTALLRSARRGDLDLIVSHETPLDVLAQQIVAESACCDYTEDELYALVRGAWPYRDLTRAQFDAVVTMVAEGFSTRKGRRAALVHRDEVNARVKGRRGARLLALTSGGAIPEVADYRVLLDPEDTFIGTLNEDFAIESNAGDVFQLGNASWRILRLGTGVVRVADAKGAPPSIPFWLGEAPARSNELSRAVSDLRADIERELTRAAKNASGTTVSQLDAADDDSDVRPAEDARDAHDAATSARVSPQATPAAPHTSNTSSEAPSAAPLSAVTAWLAADAGVPIEAAQQAVTYLAESLQALGALPTQDALVLERFFDESGGMQLVLHAPFGSRINKAWGLALRKRFCRQFNFELQAAATEDALLLSLGPQHSFPLADVFRYLHPATARDVLVQAFLDAPVFQTRWRWNTTISLAVPRNRGGKKVAPQLQRMLADDLMAAVFPDAAACLENIPGDRQIPDHPLVAQTVRDCLEEAMDFDGLSAVLARIHRGEIRCVARDTPEPSPLSHEILNARPFEFLDDAPLEERRTQAVHTRRATVPSGVDDLGALDPAAIERVRDEVRPDPRDADELHDTLLTVGLLTAGEAATLDQSLFTQLVSKRRATRVTLAAPSGVDPRARDGAGIVVGWVAAERLPELLAVHPSAELTPRLAPPPSRAVRVWTRDEAIVDIIRGRVTILGPTTALALAESLAIDVSDIDAALLALEGEGVVLRGVFTPAGAQVRGGSESFDRSERSEPPARLARAARQPRVGTHERQRTLEWCDRRLLARIHRYTLNRLRAEIEPVAPADYMRFLFAWQHVEPSSRLAGLDGLRAIISALDGFELAASAWERSVLPARIDKYEPAMLDMLCLSGDVGWARLSPTSGPAPEPTRASSANANGVRGNHATGRGTNGNGVHGDKAHAASAPTPDAPATARLGGTTAVAVFLREHADAWQVLRSSNAGDRDDRDDGLGSAGGASTAGLSEPARQVFEALRSRGALFFRELARLSGLEPEQLARAVGELVCAGLVTSDGFAGLRALIRTGRDRTPARDNPADPAGRWSLLQRDAPAIASLADRSDRGDRGDRSERQARREAIAAAAAAEAAAREAAVEAQAWALLRRYGVVFRRVLAREANVAPWRELTRVYRRLEARGEIRGGRFVTSMSGEQFALSEAVERLREVRRSAHDGKLLLISAADPLNLAGIITAGDRVRAIPTSRIVYRDGVPLAAMEGDYVRPLADIPAALAGDVATTLAGRRVPPIISGYLGRAG